MHFIDRIHNKWNFLPFENVAKMNAIVTKSISFSHYSGYYTGDIICYKQLQGLSITVYPKLTTRHDGRLGWPRLPLFLNERLKYNFEVSLFNKLLLISTRQVHEIPPKIKRCSRKVRIFKNLLFHFWPWNPRLGCLTQWPRTQFSSCLGFANTPRNNHQITVFRAG